ncbi:MAG: type IX secretion system sortase PorU [Sediminibacterium sp.]
MKLGVLTFFLIGCCCALPGWGQVGLLSKGNWVKIAVPNEGVYKLSGAQFKAMGFTGNVNANQVQLYGMDLTVLSEKVPTGLPDSLMEIAIEMQDGGDGILDDQDQFLFYAQGHYQWVHSAISEAPIRQKITSNDSLFFFLRLGTSGKRISKFNKTGIASKLVQTFAAKWRIEKDSINILNSGKIWLGDPMGIGPGKKTSMTFPLNMEGLQLNAPIVVQSQLAASTYLNDAQFNIQLNDQLLSTTSLNPVSGLIFDDAYKIRFDSSTIWLDKTKLLKAGQSLGSVNLQVNFNALSSATGWIDYLALHGQRTIGFWGNTGFGFDYQTSQPKAQLVEFEIQNATTQTRVWDLSQFHQPLSLNPQLGQNAVATFKADDNARKYFYVFEENKMNSAQFSGFVRNDTSFTSGPLDYIIITAPDYYPAAMKLKLFHEKQNGFKVGLFNATQVYNEMSSGQTTPIAIRNFLKYFIEQSKLKNQSKPSYVLLMGMGNFNAQKIQPNKELPVYTSEVSNAILTSYSSDDFYTLQKPGDQIQFAQTIDSIGLAIGRIPARTIAEADKMVEKLILYQSNKKMGLWQNQLTWVADDADFNLHLQDAEEIISNLKNKTTNWNHKKLYLDLFKANQTLTGTTYPDVNKAIQESIQAGTLVFNYTGHGNYLRLTEEAVISKSEIQNWNNAGKLPIMVTASCDFAPYDQPATAPIGFDALMQNEKGIIALVAANRLVFAYSNKQINDAFMQALLVPNSKGIYSTIGQALQAAKNYNFNQNGDRLNAFKFGLMGDPAMRIAQPKYQINCTNLNQLPWSDTLFLKAGEKYTLKGNLTAKSQAIQNFNGLMDMVLWDAPSTKKTLANQTNSQAVPIETQEQALFKGKATVKNGQFEISFILPGALPSSNSAALKLQLYAYNDTADASMQFQSIFIQGETTENRLDTTGPSIYSYVNAPHFKSGDWVTAPATLYVKLNDSSGIQSSGNQLGHDLKLIIDDTVVKNYILNSFFSYDMNAYQSGIIEYPLPVLEAGKHRLIMKAWDLLGNVSKDTIWIEVPSEKNKNIRNLMVIPNPVQTNARFSFEVNNTIDPITLQLDVFDASGSRYFSKNQKIQPRGNKIMVDWDGLSTNGGLLLPGKYYYRIIVTQNGLVEQLINSLLKF